MCQQNLFPLHWEIRFQKQIVDLRVRKLFLSRFKVHVCTLLKLVYQSLDRPYVYRVFWVSTDTLLETRFLLSRHFDRLSWIVQGVYVDVCNTGCF